MVTLGTTSRWLYGVPQNGGMLAKRYRVEERSGDMIEYQTYYNCLPRAVVGAVAEMIPNVAALGEGLLAAFAIQQIRSFVEYTEKACDRFNDLQQAEEAMKEIGQENIQLLKEDARKSEEYARQQIAQVGLMVVQEEARAELLRNQEQGLGQINPILQQVVQAYYFWTGHSKELDGLTQKLVGDHSCSTTS